MQNTKNDKCYLLDSIKEIAKSVKKIPEGLRCV